MTETIETMTTPASYGDKPLQKRPGSRGMLPSTWIGRTLRVAYTGVDGRGVETSGILLDWCGSGPVFSLAGGKTLLAWDRLIALELVND